MAENWKEIEQTTVESRDYLEWYLELFLPHSVTVKMINIISHRNTDPWSSPIDWACACQNSSFYPKTAWYYKENEGEKERERERRVSLTSPQHLGIPESMTLRLGRVIIHTQLRHIRGVRPRFSFPVTFSRGKVSPRPRKKRNGTRVSRKTGGGEFSRGTNSTARNGTERSTHACTQACTHARHARTHARTNARRWPPLADWTAHLCTAGDTCRRRAPAGLVILHVCLVNVLVCETLEQPCPDFYKNSALFVRVATREIFFIFYSPVKKKKTELIIIVDD